MRNRVRLVVYPMFAICCLLRALALEGHFERNDWLIVPGKRVGPIAPTTSRADVVKIFGAKNVTEGEIVTSDMGSEAGTEVFGSQPDMSLAILWISDAPDSRIRRIRFCPSVVLPGKCRWHTPEGIALGTSLKELERLNGHHFQVHGFDWGYGGLVTSWSGGRLGKLSSSCGGLTLRLDPPPGPASDERARLMDVVEDDEDFPSSHSAMQGLNPVIDFMSMSLQNCR